VLEFIDKLLISRSFKVVKYFLGVGKTGITREKRGVKIRQALKKDSENPAIA